MSTREEPHAEATAIYECAYDSLVCAPTTLEAKFASEVVKLRRERDEARAERDRATALLKRAVLAAEKLCELAGVPRG